MDDATYIARRETWAVLVIGPGKDGPRTVVNAFIVHSQRAAAAQAAQRRGFRHEIQVRKLTV